MLMQKTERPVSFVPKWVILALLILLASQIAYHAVSTKLIAEIKPLSSPPHEQYLALSGLSDRILTAKMLMLKLQSHDNQPGISIPLRDLNYDRVIEWLDLILSLDDRTAYPLLAAIRFYAEVEDRDKQRQMVRYVTAKFLQDPDERWPYMAHAVYIAKHRIKDMELALQTARLIRMHAKADSVPYWARQMEIFVLEDMGELEAAKVLIGGLLESGELQDVQQRAFLSQRLEEIEARQDQSPLVTD